MRCAPRADLEFSWARETSVYFPVVSLGFASKSSDRLLRRRIRGRKGFQRDGGKGGIWFRKGKRKEDPYGLVDEGERTVFVTQELSSSSTGQELYVSRSKRCPFHHGRIGSINIALRPSSRMDVLAPTRLLALGRIEAYRALRDLCFTLKEQKRQSESYSGSNIRPFYTITHPNVVMNVEIICMRAKRRALCHVQRARVAPQRQV